jgi:hypothetical protein
MCKYYITDKKMNKREKMLNKINGKQTQNHLLESGANPLPKRICGGGVNRSSPKTRYSDAL